jgi:hypothetical protein
MTVVAGSVALGRNGKGPADQLNEDKDKIPTRKYDVWGTGL